MHDSPYNPEIRGLYGAALLMFTVTVVIGILNGTGLVDFGHDAILTHPGVGFGRWMERAVSDGTGCATG